MKLIAYDDDDSDDDIFLSTAAVLTMTIFMRLIRSNIIIYSINGSCNDKDYMVD